MQTVAFAESLISGAEVDTSVSQHAEREALLAEAVRPVAAELRLVDLTCLARHILGNETANISDLIESSAELSFKEGTLTYAGTSTIDLNWGGDQSICFHLNFQNKGVKVMFELFLLPLKSAVDVKFIAFDRIQDDIADNSQRFTEALEDALVKRS
ncbi:MULTISPECIES: hypothetical protein [Pseudovibrio]|uniref:hypothetical protein n=1 Tax=Stappiaceae TaxID=2821832 RepID=UPI002365A42F|nr:MULTISPECIES: hypothetical protein [Pseudovibrio]MDD7909021.1 hypothetical protein [Pseudovibrio exalbescens]MDX5593658.1 hypothetical protein [Pseudovibrio sp. SPO723]